MQHSWPGNLRELHNVVKRYLVLGEEVLTTPPSVAALRKVAGIRGERTGSNGDLKQIVRELKGEAEAEAIRQALEQTQWRRKEAAELLGICYKALIYKSRQYGILSPREKMLPKSIGPEPVRGMSLAGAGVATKINRGRIPSLKAAGMKDAEDLR
jgi:DNA-binding NtrC family response regulator